MKPLVFALATLVLGTLVACSASSTEEPTPIGTNGGAGGSSGGTAGTPGGSGGTVNTGGDTGIILAGAGGQGGPALESVVYCHSKDTLYRLDPTSRKVTEVAAFDFGDYSGTTDVLDLAVDGAEKIFAVTEAALWSVDAKTAVATKLSDLTGGKKPFSLSFVPAGTFADAPTSEVLVAYIDENIGSTKTPEYRTDYVRIDSTSGAFTTVTEGAFDAEVRISGDLVSVVGGATYATLKENNGSGVCADSDCLVKVNPSTGKLVEDFGMIGYSKVFGLAFWGGVAYGFTSESPGALFALEFDEQGALTSTTATAVEVPAGVQFWGAGSTTKAPVTIIR